MTTYYPPLVEHMSPRLREAYIAQTEARRQAAENGEPDPIAAAHKAQFTWIPDPDDPTKRVIKTWPVDLSPAHDRDHYITGIDALNLNDETVGHAAGWQQDQCFNEHRPGVPIQTANTPSGWIVPASTLKREGVRDARPALAILRHPQAGATKPIYAALHPRAIVDQAFHYCTINQHPTNGDWWPIAPWTVADWIWTATQMDEVKRLARLAAREVPARHRASWDRWSEALEPFKTHTDFED